MKAYFWLFFGLLISCVIFEASARAEVVYTPVHVVIPANGSFRIDLDHDGVDDFVLRSTIGLVWCQLGDGGYWKLTVQTLQNQKTGVATNGVEDAAVLLSGTPIDATQTFSNGLVMMAYFAFGSCGGLELGGWRNQLNRYVGLEFQINAGGSVESHYGWIAISNVANVDQNGNLEVATVVTGFAYETVPGRTIAAGQMS